ncbi:MAG: ZrgA family zinc uptake protein, partial [Hyphococcus sp.]
MVDLRRIIILCAAPLAFALGAGRADEPDEHSHRAHDAHVHGTWELFAALDDTQLSVTIKGPLLDVLGFEHAPTNDAERDTVQEIQDRLS